MTDQQFPNNVMTDLFTVQYFGGETVEETIPYQLIEEDVVDAIFMNKPTNSSNFVKDTICEGVLCFYHSPRKRDLSNQESRIQYAAEMMHLRHILTIQYN